MNADRREPRWVFVLRRTGLILLFAIIVLCSIWAVAALFFDFPVASLRIPAAALYALAIAAAFIFLRGSDVKLGVAAAAFLIVLIWWLRIPPSNDRNWQADVSQMPWAEFHGDGDRVTIHNFRYCDYRTESDYTCAWLTKEINLSDIRGIDLSLTYWGSPWIAHTILSFQVGASDHIAMSIETRRTVGQEFSSLQGFFRRYTLVYVISDERDLIRLRTNFRKNEDVYLYRTTASPEYARALFTEYLERANDLRARPAWYNALTENCTTVVFRQMADLRLGPPPRFDWRVLLNGKMDKMEYERGNFVRTVPFEELRKRSYINAAAQAAGGSPDFSRLIREGRPGFEYLDQQKKP
jgi:Domain of unknown function (DUF4105)